MELSTGWRPRGRAAGREIDREHKHRVTAWVFVFSIDPPIVAPAMPAPASQH